MSSRMLRPSKTVAMAGGPVAGGALTSGLSWRAIFFLNLPAGLVAISLLARAPRSPLRAAPLDPAGQATAVAALAALTFGVVDGGEAGFGRPAVLGCLLLAAAAMAAFAIAETRAAHPMVPLGLFRSRAVTVCVAIGFAVNVAFYGVIFVLSLYFQRVLGQSAVRAAQLEPSGRRHAGRRGVRRADLALGLVPAGHARQPADRRGRAVRG
jgi:MFS transporter, DHA2 family, methylenomycin A resistance protein